MRKAFNEKEIEELIEVSDANPIKDGQTNLDKPQNESPMQPREEGGESHRRGARVWLRCCDCGYGGSLGGG